MYKQGLSAQEHREKQRVENRKRQEWIPVEIGAGGTGEMVMVEQIKGLAREVRLLGKTR